MRRIIGVTAAAALVFSAAAYAYTYNGTSSNDSIIGSPSPDTIYGKGGNDFLDGRESGDAIYGQAGVDQMWGDIGSDRIYCGADAGSGDQVYAEDGGDTVGCDNESFSVAVGGPGQDTFYGDLNDDYTGFEKVILNGVCRTGC